jgi:hypothetical protein
MRSIKYKSGKLLNINDRTYNIKVLADIVTHLVKLPQAFRLEKFLSSKLPKKEKLVILIFCLDYAYNDYLTAKTDGETQTFTDWLRLKITKILSEEYNDLIDNKDESEW